MTQGGEVFRARTFVLVQAAGDDQKFRRKTFGLDQFTAAVVVFVVIQINHLNMQTGGAGGDVFQFQRRRCVVAMVRHQPAEINLQIRLRTDGTRQTSEQCADEPFHDRLQKSV